MRTPARERLLDINELADWLGFTPKGIRAMRYRGEAPPAVKVGGRIKWRPADVERWLDAQRDTATPAR
jgi:predicted DNA-binding transcriptional regulator AlpA